MLKLLLSTIMFFIAILASNNIVRAAICTNPDYPNSCWFECCEIDAHCCGWNTCCNNETGKVVGKTKKKNPSPQNVKKDHLTKNKKNP